MWKKQRIILSLRIRIYGLQVLVIRANEKTVIVLLVLALVGNSIYPTADFDINIGCLIFIKKIVQLMMRALHCI